MYQQQTISKLCYPPQVVMNFFINKGMSGYHKYWSCGSIVAEIQLEYRQVQTILNRFTNDGYLARQTNRDGTRIYKLKRSW